MKTIADASPLNILNLFAYTGGATMALATDGHHVTHVDASKPTIAWAKENATLNKIPGDRIRWIVDDAMTFCAREEKRGNRYDGMILDPPAYGHGPDGKAWRVERDLAPLLDCCARLLSDDATFFVVNGYARNQESQTLSSLLRHALSHQKNMSRPNVEHGELFLTDEGGRQLSTGIYARWNVE
jgi:23S rRNA (cytosine1962-C5)-methyltransferase